MSLLEEASRLAHEDEIGDQCQNRILGDAFHVMDRIRVPVHHDWKWAYFSALRDAISLFDASDKDKVERVLRRSGKSWEETIVHRFSYVALRVRRRIPPPKVLHARVKAVFIFFASKTDSKTGLPLFGQRANKMAEAVLAAILRGELSDPPDFQLYVPIHSDEGVVKHDRDGLVLWRCLRGTGPAESAHSQYTRSFGQVRAGPLYSIAVLRNHHHRKSWRASARNRPGFPTVYHYDCWLMDMLNHLHAEVFDRLPKYGGWPQHEEAVPTKRSAFGIIPLIEDSNRPPSRKPCKLLSRNMQHLAALMEGDLPYTPVALKEERILFKHLLEDILKEGGPINQATFHELSRRWNHEHVSVPESVNDMVRIYPKYTNHLIGHYKRWRKNTKKKAAMDEAEQSGLLVALRSTKATVPMTPFDIQPLQPSQPIFNTIPQNAVRQDTRGVLQQLPHPQQLPPPQGVPVPVEMAMPPTPVLYWSPHVARPTATEEPERVKRKRGICQKCYNPACSRPYNRKGICNS